MRKQTSDIRVKLTRANTGAGYSRLRDLFAAPVFIERALWHILSFIMADVVRFKNRETRIGILRLNLGLHIRLIVFVRFVFHAYLTAISPA